MSLLYRVIYAAHAKGTHHKLALDALRHLRHRDANLWQRLFLAHAKSYLEGAKAPDDTFKDFKNHVLHVRDNYWGGAPEKARNWYEHLLRAMRESNWPETAYCAGVLSHYYTDPIHPFHTAQSEAENNIHRAVEWSISKSYDDLRALGEPRYGGRTVALGEGPTWLADAVIGGAEFSNAHYERLIAHYDFKRGVVDPPSGLDEVARDIVAELLIYAAIGFAGILDRAIGEAGVKAPEVSLTLETILATAKMPAKWISKRLADKEDRLLVESMYDELMATGRVDKCLPADDRVVRDLYEKEIAAPRRAAQLTARAERAPRDKLAVRAERTAPSRLPPAMERPPVAPPAIIGSAAPAASGDQKMSTEAAMVPSTSAVPRAGAKDIAGSVVSLNVGERDTRDRQPPKIYLQPADDVERGPSIGPKTAARLSPVGIKTVADLLACDPEMVAAQLDVRHITASVIADWQDQARLVCEIAGLRGTHAQILVGAGFRSPEDVAAADPTDLQVRVLRFAGTPEGERVLRDGDVPDLEQLSRWVSLAEAAVAA